MRGYVVKKGKNYYAVVYDGVDPGTGKEKRKWVSAGPRRSDAEKLVTDLVKRRNKGGSVTAEKLSLGIYLTARYRGCRCAARCVDQEVVPLGYVTCSGSDRHRVGVQVDPARGPDEDSRIAVQGVRQRNADRCPGAGGQLVETDAFDELGSWVHHRGSDSIRFHAAQ